MIQYLAHGGHGAGMGLPALPVAVVFSALLVAGHGAPPARPRTPPVAVQAPRWAPTAGGATMT